jgi:hypothetical protein
LYHTNQESICKVSTIQGGLLWGHKSTPVKHKHMLFHTASSSQLITEDLPGSWQGRYMRMDSSNQHSLYVPQSVRYNKLPPPRVLLPATSQDRLHGVLGQKSVYEMSNVFCCSHTVQILILEIQTEAIPLT